jgi:hypothetical protein
MLTAWFTLPTIGNVDGHETMGTIIDEHGSG